MLPVLAEIWLWFSVTFLVVAARWISRRILARSWHFQSDDYLMVLALMCYTVVIASDTALLWEAQVGLLLGDYDSDVFRNNYAKYSVYSLVYDNFSFTTSWLCKGCMLIMYHRMTYNLRQNTAIKVLAGIVVFTWLFIELGLIAIWCHPLHGYLEQHPINKDCEVPTKHMITIAVCNITTDLLLMAITIPMFITSRLPIRKKILIVSLFSLGIITIIITALNRIGTFYAVTGFSFFRWNVREASMAVIVTNLPLTMPLWQTTKKLTSILPYGSGTNRSGKETGHSASYAVGRDGSGLHSSPANEDLGPGKLTFDTSYNFHDDDTSSHKGSTAGDSIKGFGAKPAKKWPLHV